MACCCLLLGATRFPTDFYYQQQQNKPRRAERNEKRNNRAAARTAPDMKGLGREGVCVCECCGRHYILLSIISLRLKCHYIS